jgi:hypothetical protein
MTCLSDDPRGPTVTGEARRYLRDLFGMRPLLSHIGLSHGVWG